MRARNKFGFINETIKRPDETSSDLEDWWTINSLLVSWIRNTIEPTLRSTISHVEVAQDLWTYIKELFLVVNGQRIQQLKTELADCKQKGLTIVTYYGKLKMLCDELANFKQICRRASAGSALVISEERVKAIAREKEERGEAMAFAAQSTPDYRGRGEWKDKNVVCSNCKRSGHESENCFLLVGYHEWWGDRPRGDGKAGGRGRGQQQQKMGHNGSRGRGGTSRANVV
ncbi:hypothetical protein RJ640_024086 [Escallonia rubra]|uniref:Retrotransposon gag domain-containing protein n=1 Tax=Escallonia rubra TaxID=112253 RepID=A0AA88R777_9ASTE|nr:hypothetical protein RJ640_024086 [Escallonia rubra]